MEKPRVTLKEIYPFIITKNVRVIFYSTNRLAYKGRDNAKFKKFKDYLVEGVWSEISVDKSKLIRQTFTQAESCLYIGIIEPDKKF